MGLESKGIPVQRAEIDDSTNGATIESADGSIYSKETNTKVDGLRRDLMFQLSPEEKAKEQAQQEKDKAKQEIDTYEYLNETQKATAKRNIDAAQGTDAINEAKKVAKSLDEKMGELTELVNNADDTVRATDAYDDYDSFGDEADAYDAEIDEGQAVMDNISTNNDLDEKGVQALIDAINKAEKDLYLAELDKLTGKDNKAIVETVKYKNSDPRPKNEYDQAIKAGKAIVDDPDSSSAQEVLAASEAVKEAQKKLNGKELSKQPTARQEGNAIVGEGVTGATVELVDENGNSYSPKVTATVEDGKYKLELPEGVEDGTKVKVVQTEEGKAPTTSKEVTVDKTAPSEPTVEQPTAKDTSVTVILPKDAQAGDKVIVKVDGGKEIAHEITAEDIEAGKVSVVVPELATGNKVTAKVEDKAGNVSKEASKTVQDQATKVTPNTPKTTVPVDNKDSLNQGEKDAVKKAVEDANKGNLPDGTEVTVGNDGTATITYPDGSQETIPGTSLVSQKDASEEPTARQEGNAIVGEGVTGATVELVDENGNSYSPKVTATVEDGKYTLNLPEGVKDGDKVKVVQREPGKAPTTSKEVTVDKTAPSEPTVEQPTAKDTSVTVILPKDAQAGDKVIVKVDGGKEITHEITAEDIEAGKVSVVVPELATGNKVTAKVEDKAGNVSKEASKTVQDQATKVTPNTPKTTVPVDNKDSLNQGEKDAVKKAVEDANKGNLPDGTEVTVGNDGTATITYPDGSQETIPGTSLVSQKDADTTPGNTTAPSNPGENTNNNSNNTGTEDHKSNAIEEIKKAAENKKADIDNNKDMTDKEKQEAKAKVEEIANKAIDEINKSSNDKDQIDKIKTVAIEEIKNVGITRENVLANVDETSTKSTGIDTGDESGALMYSMFGLGAAGMLLAAKRKKEEEEE